MDMTPEALRARFAELKPQVDARLAASKPLRDKLSNEWADLSRNQADALREEIRTEEAGLMEMQNELATISRALGGRTAFKAEA